MNAIKIGLLIAETGPAGLWAPSARACANLAAQEINAEAGLLGRPMELVTIDVGCNGRTAAAAARHAMDIEDVAAIIGMFPSYARQPVLSAIGDAVPLIYTPQFEGFECDPHIVTTGETSAELMGPAIDWLVRTRKASRFFLCGSDYLWPRSSFALAKRMIRDAGAIVTGEMYLPLDYHQYGPAFQAIRTTHSDVVLPHFLGLDAVRFNRAYAQEGLAAQAVRLACAVDETVIYGLDEDATENMFVASAYFSSVRSRNNGAFLERYHDAYGDSPPPANAYGQSCYEGLYCLAGLVKAAGTLATRPIRAALGKAVQQKSARGDESAPLVGGRHPVHIGRVEGFDIRLVNRV
jgi:ABC-type branched-subunit amino acid transport system substrate-binding protein